jgi:signal transduction histidine kinase
MHRRLFVWFTWAMIASGITVAGTMHLFGNGSQTWRVEVERVRHFVSDEYARVWNDPGQRAALSNTLSHDLQLGVQVTDEHERVLDLVDMPTHCRMRIAFDLQPSHGPVLGHVEMCGDRHRMGPRPWLLALGLFVAGVVLWGLAGKVARHLAQPLSELTQVAREIGEGNLASRARLCRPIPGEVGELTIAINDMAERIERQLKDQRELLATVSHEMRTPLQRVRLLLELAAEGGTDRKLLDEIDGEVVEIDALVGQLLASARVDFAALSPRSLDAGDVVRRAVERSGLTGARADVEPTAGTLMADATLLSRALAALLDNARKYGGAAVTVRVRGTPETVAFDVDDDGRGFAPGEEQKVFEAFYRGIDRADDARGIGLGLSLVKRIAEAHGGRVYARNLEAGGARVGVELPREPRARRPA